MMTRQLFVSMAVIGWTSAASAEMPIPDQARLRDKFKPAIVIVQDGGTRLGTGIIVAEDPVIVATCFHVVRGLTTKTLNVVSPSVGSMQYAVTGINSDRKAEDLAFLRLEALSWSPQLTWASEPKPSGTNPSLVTFGYSYPPSTHLKMMPQDVQGVELLTKLTGGPGSQLIALDLGSARPLYYGDSGGPLVDAAGKLVGLAAGAISYSNGGFLWFAIPRWAALPDSKTYTGAAPNVDPYGAFASADVQVYSLRTLKEKVASYVSSMNAAAANCISPMADAIAPLVVEGKAPVAVLGSQACQSYYAQLRPVLIEELADSRAEVALRNFAAAAARVEQFADTKAQDARLRSIAEKSEDRRVIDTYKGFCLDATDLRGPHGPGARDRCVGGEVSWSRKNETWHEVMADPKKLDEAWALMIRRGDALSDQELRSTMQLGARVAQSLVPRTPENVGALTSDVKIARDASSDLVRRATEGKPLAEPAPLARVIAALSLEPGTRATPSSKRLSEAADKRLDSAQRLAAERVRILSRPPAAPVPPQGMGDP